jgi:hypothetical protein
LITSADVASPPGRLAMDPLRAVLPCIQGMAR